MANTSPVRRPDFRQVFYPRQFHHSADGTHSAPTTLIGTVKPIEAPELGFAFIRGEDGQDYFLHRSELLSEIDWPQFCALPNCRVEFTAQPVAKADKISRALAVFVVGLTEGSQQTSG